MLMEEAGEEIRYSLKEYVNEESKENSIQKMVTALYEEQIEDNKNISLLQKHRNIDREEAEARLIYEERNTHTESSMII